jgi:hypothetical protein
LGEYVVENLFLLCSNRLKKNIIFISSKPWALSHAINQDFPVVPIIPFHNFQDKQLRLLEIYLLKIRNMPATQARNDF